MVVDYWRGGCGLCHLGEFHPEVKSYFGRKQFRDGRLTVKFFLAIGALLVIYTGFQAWMYFISSAGKTVFQKQCSFPDYWLNQCATGIQTPSTVQNY